MRTYKEMKYDKEIKDLSNTQRYKIAGNGLSINVVEKLFRQILQVINK